MKRTVLLSFVAVSTLLIGTAPATAAQASAPPPAKHEITAKAEQFYFMLPDRFANRAIADLGKLRRDHAALRDGVQVTHHADEGAGVFAFSRVDPRERIEYVAAVNNATTARTVTVDTWIQLFHAGVRGGQRDRRRTADDHGASAVRHGVSRRRADPDRCRPVGGAHLAHRPGRRPGRGGGRGHR